MDDQVRLLEQCEMPSTGHLVEEDEVRWVRQVLPTHGGQELLSSTRAALRAAEGVLMRDLTDDEQDQLRRLLARVAAGAGNIEACTTAG